MASPARAARASSRDDHGTRRGDRRVVGTLERLRRGRRGKIVVEAKVIGEPEALVAWLRAPRFEPMRIGLEAVPLSQWQIANRRGAGLADARHGEVPVGSAVGKVYRISR